MNAFEVLAGQPQRIALVGDLHGNVSAADAALRWAAEQGADVVVQVGDFGFGFDTTQHEGSFLPRLCRLTRELELPLLWLGGNHDNWDAIDEQRAEQDLGGSEPWLMSDWIVQLPVGYRLPWGEHGWLVIAGATSVDRPWRHPGVSWWPQEVQLTDAAAARIVADHRHAQVDVVLSHDAFWTASAGSRRLPAGTLARHLNWNRPLSRRFSEVRVACTRGTLREADEHAKRVRAVIDQVLRPGGAFFHGHMHYAYTDQVAGWNVHGLAADTQRPDQGLCLLIDRSGTPIIETP